MAYKENLTRFIEMYDLNIKVVCDIDWNGRAGNSDVYVKSVNDLLVSFIETDMLTKIEDEVKDHEANIRKDREECKAEMMGDEMRGN